MSAEFEDITIAGGELATAAQADQDWGHSLAELRPDIAERINDLIRCEIGRIDCFRIIESERIAHVEPVLIKPREITHGPQRKGRGGKIRRWG